MRFYNGQDQLVYQERLAACFDLARRGHRSRRTSRWLTAALQRVLRDPRGGAARHAAGLAACAAPPRGAGVCQAIRVLF